MHIANGGVMDILTETPPRKQQAAADKKVFAIFFHLDLFEK